MRARDASTSASWRRTSTRRRAISIASPAAPIVLSSRSGRSASDGSWTTVASGRPPRRTGVRVRPADPGRSTTRPAASTSTSPSRRKRSSSAGSPSASASMAPVALGRGAARAQLLQEALDGLQPRVAGAVEAAVDEQLHPGAQRPEEQRDGERRRRRGERRAGADRHPDAERDRREDGRQRRGQRDVDQRAVDQPVDLVEPVAQDRDAHRGRHRRQRQDRGRERRRAVLAGDGDLQQADRDRGGDQRRGVGEPLQLAAARCPEARRSRDRTAATAPTRRAERAERAERVREPITLRQLRAADGRDARERLGVRLVASSVHTTRPA